ncbi:MAG: hypothetical protein WA880_12235 [Ornithinimicrobium sp.]
MTNQPSPDAESGTLDGAQAHDDDRADDLADDGRQGGGQVSEAGGASLNAETSLGGADAVPDAHG